MRSVSLRCGVRVAAVAAAVAVLVVPAPAVASVAWVSAGGRVAAAAGAQLVLSRQVAPPTSVIRVSGSGFGASERVGIFFDSTELISTQASGSGTFGPVKVTIPASAPPGRHTISATGSGAGRVAAAVFTVRTDWAQFRFKSRRSGLNLFENVLSIYNVAGLANRWTLATGAAVQSSPTVVGGAVYIASNDGTLHAVRAATGKPMWTRYTSRPIQSSPAVAHGVVYVGTGGGGPVLLALKASTGAKLWAFSLANTSTAVLGSPAVANGVYAGATNGYLYALNAATGKKLWRFHQGGDGQLSPVVASGVVYTASTTGTSDALNAATGRRLWSLASWRESSSCPPRW